jgi:hypothetical protein
MPNASTRKRVSRIRRAVRWPRPCGCASLTTGRTGPARGRQRKGSPHWRPQEARWCARPRRSMAFPRSARPAWPKTQPPRSRRSATTLPPRGATAGRTARDPATPAYGGCHDIRSGQGAPVAHLFTESRAGQTRSLGAPRQRFSVKLAAARSCLRGPRPPQASGGPTWRARPSFPSRRSHGCRPRQCLPCGR